MNQVKAVAEAMQKKRRELIARPLNDIWEELAVVAIDEASRIRLIEVATMEISEDYVTEQQRYAKQEAEAKEQRKRKGLLGYLFKASKREAKDSAA